MAALPRRWLRGVKVEADFELLHAGPRGPAFVHGMLGVAMKGNKAGLIGVALLTIAFTVPAFHKPILYLLFQISALSCSVVAFRSGKKWLALMAVSVILTLQALFAAMIEG